MVTKKVTGIVLGVFIMAEAIYLAYYFIELRKIENFTCHANFVQHYSQESYYVSISYTVRKNFGLLHITGMSDKDPKKIFNRKIPFNFQRNGDIYYMTSKKNIKFPDDNFNDKELGQYEPGFFISPGRDIYMRILPQENNNLLFIVDSIPTYVCNRSSGQS
ncbi:hypothetical protein [Pantoea sp. C2G6]|uniref:hypothetical protein n=1 Tax=Pantoea sp. C2G6 TaxID=3243084 RepID=UPI003EDA3BD9